MAYNPLLGAGVDSIIKHLSCAPHLKELKLVDVKMTPQQVMDLTSAVRQHGNITKLRSEYHDFEGNPKPEHEWPSEEDWKEWYPSLFSHSSNESQPQKQQIPAETRLSIHESPFFAHEQDTVGTFPAPPDPTADPMLTEASIPTTHGSSHGLVPHVQYSEHYASLDIHTHHHSAPSTIFTPGGSLSTDSYLISGPGPSTVTQDEPIDEELNLPSSSSKGYDEQVALQEECPRGKQKAGKKRKVQEMITEEIVEPQRKKKKRKKGKAEQGTEAGDEKSPLKRKKRKKRKVHQMTEDVEGTSRKRRKRKKHKEHRRDKGGEESTRKGKPRKKRKEGRVTEQGDEESPRKTKKRKQHKSHRVTEGDEEPRRKRSKRE
ncbi:uncharacterized protein [Porites lutea]|uniref:uncharacterized protein n=1 Tax=Porites lutea TaxID=51062 RepID=UPI003CC66320